MFAPEPRAMSFARALFTGFIPNASLGEISFSRFDLNLLYRLYVS
jgi:hypothetical protein